VHHTHHLELTVADTPFVLDRVVSVCRARRCAILALRYEAADRHRPGRVLATLAADGQRLRLATQRLASMPGVLAVAHLGERAQVHTRGVSDPVSVGAAGSYGSR
jgi:acetolactate synthase small subunit